MLVLENISKKFGTNNLFNNMSYTFEDNKCYYIVGKSGVGKTTLLNVIYGYEKFDSGSIRTMNSSMEYMFQDTLLFENLSIRENFLIKCAAVKCNNNNDNVFEHLLSKVGLDKNLDTMVNTLSGGEKQRLYMAQLTFSNPGIILLDEPACKLDSENRKNIYELANNIYSNSTKIIVTHDNEVNYMDGIILEIREGKLWEV